MKKLIVTAALVLASLPSAFAQSVGVHGMEDGVGAGGSGGNPNAMGSDTVNVQSFKSEAEAEVEEVLSTSFMTNSMAPSASLRANTVLVDREEMLKAVDAALNSSDIEMEIEEKPSTVRLQRFDLERGILHGRILESNRAVRLMDATKVGRSERLPLP